MVLNHSLTGFPQLFAYDCLMVILNIELLSLTHILYFLAVCHHIFLEHSIALVLFILDYV